jgi:hypothetical protein
MRAWVFGLIVATAPSFTAEARDARNFVLNGWMASSFREPNGRFSHCSALAFFEAGTSAVVSVDRDYTWSLGFGISSWRLDKRTVTLTYSFDGGPWQTGTGKVQNPRFVTLIPNAKASVTELLKDRHAMEIQLDGESLYFQLYDSNELLDRLASCYRQAISIRLPLPPLCRMPSHISQK